MEGKSCMYLLKGYLLLWALISTTYGQDPDNALADTNPTTELNPTSVATEANTDTDDALTDTNPTTEVNPTSVATESNTVGQTVANTNNPEMPNSTGATEEPNLTCQKFECMGMNCYKERNVYTSSSDSECSHNSYCELYRHNSSYYEARCEEHCIHHECPKDGTPMDGCSIYCCNTSKCLTLDNVLGSMNDTTVWQTTAPATTITQATTIATVVYSDKMCRSFRCDGADCYKNHANAATKKCQVGINHCELQKKVTGTTVSYEGGCSNTCATSTKSCSRITNSDCFHECCNATTTACCMKLDGQVHFNTAAHINLSSVLKIFSYAFIVIFSSCFFSSQWA